MGSMLLLLFWARSQRMPRSMLLLFPSQLSFLVSLELAVRVKGLKNDKFEKERIRSNLVFMEKHLILDDDFLAFWNNPHWTIV